MSGYEKKKRPWKLRRKRFAGISTRDCNKPIILPCALPVLLIPHDPISRPWFGNRPYLLYDRAHYCSAVTED